jgi:FkbM family methyltransferase
MGRLVGPQGSVWAFEPFPPAFRELQAHVGLNHMRMVRCFPVALSGTSGEQPFLPGESAATGQLLSGSNRLGQQTLSVAARRLDDLPEISGLRRLDVMKIDVEGAESGVLAGGENTIDRFRPVLIVELHSPEQDVSVARWLLAHRYSFRRLTPGPPIERFDAGWPERTGVWGTLIARPSEHNSGQP